jgi:hypothetical protein
MLTGCIRAQFSDKRFYKTAKVASQRLGVLLNFADRTTIDLLAFALQDPRGLA